MPILTNLGARLRADRSWRSSYKVNLTTSRVGASKIYLVHVSGNPDRASFLRLLSTPPHEIPISEAVYNYCSNKTRQAEDMLGIGRSVYFFAGRAHQEFGEIALAFDPRCEDSHAGSATPFDTGGLADRKITTNLSSTSARRLRKFVKESEFPLRSWRKQFSRFLAAYFSPPSNYWED